MTNATAPSPTSAIVELPPARVRAMMVEGKARLVDVREPSEHRAERIEGATSMPLSAFDPAAIESSGSVITVLHCKGGTRSRQAAQRLIEAGHRSASSMAGGIEAWKKAGLTTVVDRSAPMDTMRQTQLVIGTGVLASIIAGVLWTPYALGLGAFFGAGLIYAGLSGSCTLNTIMGKMPWNRAPNCAANKSSCGGDCSGR